MFNFDWRRYPRIFMILVALFLLGASFFSGVYYGYEKRPAVERVLNVFGKTPPPDFTEVDFDPFWDVWRRLEDKYVDRDKVNRKDMVLGAISGLVKSLKDPYTEFLPPPETKQFQEDIRGSFSGIGAEIGIRRGTLTIISPLKDSPAEQAGLKAGDKILKVDDTFTADLTLDLSLIHI